MSNKTFTNPAARPVQNGDVLTVYDSDGNPHKYKWQDVNSYVDSTTGAIICTTLAASGNVTISGTISITGGITGAKVESVKTVDAATYSVLETDININIDYTDTGAVAIELPTAQLLSGRTIYIKDSGFNASTNNITISTEGAEKIDGEDTAVIATDGEALTLYSDGTHWFIR